MIRSAFLIPALGFVLLATMCGILSVSAQESVREARKKGKFLAEAGSIEGAIWAFELKPQTGPKSNSTIKGRYRVSGLNLYQAEQPGGEMTKQIGTSKPNTEDKTTIAEFNELKGMNGPKQWAEPITGKALLKLKSFGELEGDFIDSKGFKWTMILKRVRE